MIEACAHVFRLHAIHLYQLIGCQSVDVLLTYRCKLCGQVKTERELDVFLRLDVQVKREEK